MQPFAIYCETCGARLKVRDPKVVGEIHACPRCESMVLIAPPTEVAAAPAKLQQASASSTEPLVPVDFASEIDAILDPEALVPAGAAGDHAAATAVQKQPATIELVTPSRLGPSRLGLGTVIWGTAGVVACMTLGLFFASWWNQPISNRQAQLVPSPEVPADLSADETLFTSSESSNTTPEPITKPPSPVVAAVTADQQAANDVKSEVESPNSSPGTTLALPELPPQPVAAPSANNQAEVASRATPLDPLAIDPYNLDLLLTDPPPALPLPKSTERTPPVAATPPQQEEVAPVPQRFPPGSARPGPRRVERVAPGDFDARLAMRVPAVRWENAPLEQAFADLSQLAGVPITVLPSSLQMAAVSASEPISLVRQDVTVRELATALAGVVRLEVPQHGQQLVLEKPDAERVREINYRVDDLVAVGEQDAAGVAQLIRQFVAPEVWQQEESLKVDGLSLQIQQPAKVQYETLLFCERLRKARGLPTRSRYPAERLEIEPRLAMLAPALTEKATFTFIDWTPLAEVFGYWQEKSGVTILVDWVRLADQDQRPQSTLAGSAHDVPWHAALDACLTPLELGWTPVDGTTIQITTREAAAQRCWVEFYRIADFPLAVGSRTTGNRPPVEQVTKHLQETCDMAVVSSLAVAGEVSEQLVVVRGNRAVHECLLRWQTK